MDSAGHFQLIRPDPALALRGIRVLVGGPESAPGIAANGNAADVQLRVDGFLAYAQSIDLDITRQVVALSPATPGNNSLIAGMCLWVPAPGRTAMLFSPSPSEFPQVADTSLAALQVALDEVRATGVVLAQAMVEPSDAASKTVFAAAGLTQLATLTFMERKPPILPPAFVLPPDLILLPYEAATHALFSQAIVASYEETLDCPRMAGLRDVEDIIEGHKATGRFDPQLWGVLLRQGKPIGCLLLAEITARRALELAYLGLAREARGQGLGRILMQCVLAIGAKRHFELATLAVDAANTPAVKLYRRCGYASIAQRVAMIKRL